MTNKDRALSIMARAKSRAEIHAIDNANITMRLDRMEYDRITPKQWGQWIKVYNDSLEILIDLTE
jgi:predicted helicase